MNVKLEGPGKLDSEPTTMVSARLSVGFTWQGWASVQFDGVHVEAPISQSGTLAALADEDYDEEDLALMANVRLVDELHEGKREYESGIWYTLDGPFDDDAEPEA